MKKKVLAIMMVCLTLAFVGCGSTTSNDAAAEAPKVETAKTESVTKEEPKASEKVEKTEEKTETKVEEKTEEKVKEKLEEKVEETASAAEASTEVQEKVDETAAEAAPTESATTEKVEEAPAEPTYATVIEKYIADGDFTDYKEYGMEMGANNVKIASSEKNIDFYFNDYIVSVRTNVQNTDEYTYVAIGLTDGTTMTYACDILFTGKPTVPVSASGSSVSIESLMLLEQTINYMKQNPNPNQIPDIPGMTWVVW